MTTDVFRLDKGHPAWYSMAGVFEEVVRYARTIEKPLTRSEHFRELEALREKMFRVCQMCYLVGAQAVFDDVQNEHFNRGLRIDGWPQAMLDLNREETNET